MASTHNMVITDYLPEQLEMGTTEHQHLLSCQRADVSSLTRHQTIPSGLALTQQESVQLPGDSSG